MVSGIDNDAVENYIHKITAILDRYPSDADTATVIHGGLPVKSYVYFMQERISGCIKIGTTIDPFRRRREIKFRRSRTRDFIGIMPGTRALERELHERFAATRVEGEWFRPSADLFKYIKHYAYWPTLEVLAMVQRADCYRNFKVSHLTQCILEVIRQEETRATHGY